MTHNESPREMMERLKKADANPDRNHGVWEYCDVEMTVRVDSGAPVCSTDSGGNQEVHDADGVFIASAPDMMRLIRALEAKLEMANRGLKEARNNLESWGAYADAYFQEKWGLAGDIAGCDLILAATKLDTWNEPQPDEASNA